MMLGGFVASAQADLGGAGDTGYFTFRPIDGATGVRVKCREREPAHRNHRFG
jgi:hypothetical protein